MNAPSRSTEFVDGDAYGADFDNVFRHLGLRRLGFLGEGDDFLYMLRRNSDDAILVTDNIVARIDHHAADPDVVSKARDTGVNEFLAKPFSPLTVSERLLSVIDRPRQFVATREYFGPDRKRREVDDLQTERRYVKDEDATVPSASFTIRRVEPATFAAKITNNRAR